MYHFNYVTTNLLNGKQYIGKHSTNNIEDGYLGSGTLLKKDIKEFGVDKFKRDIIKMCKSSRVAKLNETSLILEYNTLHPNGYNLHKNGGYYAPIKEDEEKTIQVYRTGYDFSDEEMLKVVYSNGLISLSDYLIGKDKLLKNEFGISGKISSLYWDYHRRYC